MCECSWTLSTFCPSSTPKFSLRYIMDRGNYEIVSSRKVACVCYQSRQLSTKTKFDFHCLWGIRLNSNNFIQKWRKAEDMKGCFYLDETMSARSLLIRNMSPLFLCDIFLVSATVSNSTLSYRIIPSYPRNHQTSFDRPFFEVFINRSKENFIKFFFVISFAKRLIDFDVGNTTKFTTMSPLERL